MWPAGRRDAGRAHRHDALGRAHSVRARRAGHTRAAAADRRRRDGVAPRALPEATLHARNRLLAEADGNPLALLELPIALDVRGAASATLPRVLPLTERLEQVFASRLAPLPPESREALLLAGVGGTGHVAVLWPDGG